MPPMIAEGIGLDQNREFGEEGEDYRDKGGDADHPGIIHLGQRKHTGILAVGGIGRSAEESGEAACKAVAEQGAGAVRERRYS